MTRFAAAFSAFFILLSHSIQPSHAQNATNILSFVDPLIGTINGGHVFAGASLPFSMAKAVADTNGGELQGGFASDGSNITGFSHMHDSGTGGVSLSPFYYPTTYLRSVRLVVSKVMINFRLLDLDLRINEVLIDV